MYIKFWIFLFTWVVSSQAYTQIITFEKVYGGVETEQGYSVLPTSDNGYLVVGYTESFGSGGDDAYILKTDEYGDLLWSKTYGGSLDDVLFSAEQTNDGGFIFCGSYTVPSNSRIMYLIKTDQAGDSLWTRKYPLSDYCILKSVKQLPDGGYIIAGYGSEPVDMKIYLIRTDEYGDTLWIKRYGGASVDLPGSLILTNDGGYVIAGTTYSFGAGGSDVYLIKTDANGNILWTRTYGGGSDDWGESVQQTSDGGYIIAGWTKSFGNIGYEDYYLVKVDSNGNEAWSKTFGEYIINQGFSVVQTTDGGYALAGWVWNTTGTPDRSIYLVKTDSDGNLVSSNFIDSSNICMEYAYDIKQTPDKGFIITGSACSPINSGPDVYLVKTDSLFDIPTGIPNEHLSADEGVNVYPNPFNDFTVFSMDVMLVDQYSLIISDILGREIKVINNITSKQFKLKRGNLVSGSGVYIYQLHFENKHISTGKLIVQ